MRKGLGLNRGRGYFNLVPQDHIVHSLSAKGVKSYSKEALAKKFSDFNVIAIHTGKNLQDPKVKGFAIETRDEPYDRSNAIFDRIPEAKNVQAIRNMAKGYYYSVLFSKGKKHKGKDKEEYLADYKTYTIYRLDRWGENMEDDDEPYGEHHVGSELYLVPEDEEDKFGEFMADEYGYQDYNNKINLHKLGKMTGAEIMEIAHQYHKERKKTTKYDLDAKSTMSVEDAKKILGDRATWELKNMKKALSSMQILNTPEENKRLEAVKVMLRQKNKSLKAKGKKELMIPEELKHSKVLFKYDKANLPTVDVLETLRTKMDLVEGKDFDVAFVQTNIKEGIIFLHTDRAVARVLQSNAFKGKANKTTYKELADEKVKIYGVSAKGKKPIMFNKKGDFLSVDKSKLKKHTDYGYYLIHNGLIHFFDDDKNYERSKFYTGLSYPLGKDVKPKPQKISNANAFHLLLEKKYPNAEVLDIAEFMDEHYQNKATDKKNLKLWKEFVGE